MWVNLRHFAVIQSWCRFNFSSIQFDEEFKPADKMVEKVGVTLLIDQMSYQYLAGSGVDFVEGLEGAMFVVNNPNATAICGCDASFSI